MSIGFREQLEVEATPPAPYDIDGLHESLAIVESLMPHPDLEQQVAEFTPVLRKLVHEQVSLDFLTLNPIPVYAGAVLTLITEGVISEAFGREFVACALRNKAANRRPAASA